VHSKRVMKWCCDYCGKQHAHKIRCLGHELHCWKNPQRIPYFGELTHADQMGKVLDYGFDESINGTWLEWTEHDEMPQWWPGHLGEYGGAGCIYAYDGWHVVEGYRQDPAPRGHGCAGGSCGQEIWPVSAEGKTLDSMRTWDRLAFLDLEGDYFNKRMSEAYEDLHNLLQTVANKS